MRITFALNEELVRTSHATGCAPAEDYSVTYDAAPWGVWGYRICARIDYTIELPAGATMQLNTVSDNIVATGIEGPVYAKTISGSVDLSWPAALSAEVALQTMMGEVYTNHALLSATPQPTPSEGHQVPGPLGRKGPAIHLESITGNVFFRQPK